MEYRNIRVAIIQRDGLYRDSLGHYLEQADGILIVHSASTVDCGGKSLLACKPDLLIIEFGLSCRGGPDSAEGLRSLSAVVKTLVIGVPNNEEHILACIEGEGVAGYLLMDASLDDLVNNVHAVMRGETLCSLRIASLAFGRVSSLARQIGDYRSGNGTCLTRREAEIVRLIDDGLSNKEIAVRLHIEVSTVKNHVHNILDKLQLHNRYSAVKLAKAQGLTASRS